MALRPIGTLALIAAGTVVLTGQWQAAPVVVGIMVVVYAVMFSVAFPVEYVRAFNAASQAGMVVPAGAVPCARCLASPRTGSGWCAPCAQLLAASPVPPDHVVRQWIAAMDGKVFKSMGAQVGETVTIRYPSGGERRISRTAWVRGQRINSWAFGRRTGSRPVLALDPTNQEIVWTRTHDRAAGRWPFSGLDVTLVYRYWLPHEQVVEIAFYPALPNETTGRVGTKTRTTPTPWS